MFIEHDSIFLCFASSKFYLSFYNSVISTLLYFTIKSDFVNLGVISLISERCYNNTVTIKDQRFMPKILAIDYGDKRVGLATADIKLKVALPFCIVENQGAKKLLDDIAEICRKEEIEKIIVGFPMGLSGIKTKQTDKTEKFAVALEKMLKIPIIRQSEVFTSREARGIFKDAKIKKKRIDESAAVLILTDYLEKRDN